MNVLLNFSRLRSRYRGPINPMAYIGMAGDLVVIGGLYFYWKSRKNRKEALKLANVEVEKERNL